jgi:DNA repair protein RadC
MAHGAKILATAELIAILLGTGQGPGKLSAVGLGQYLLKVRLTNNIILTYRYKKCQWLWEKELDTCV